MVDIREQSPISLAFVGDSVYSLLVREYLTNHHRFQPAKLHSEASRLVSAKGQSEAFLAICNMLTPEEKQIYLRGRNASKMSVAKHASAEEYRCSTGFEALFGWLYLQGLQSRIEELFHAILDKMQNIGDEQSR